jgi:hypothetical protein
MSETVTLSGTASNGTLIELPVTATFYGENLIEDPSPTGIAWTTADGSITALPGYLYWDGGSGTIAQHIDVPVEAGKTYELSFEGIIFDGSVEARLNGSGAVPIVIDPASAFGRVGTFAPDTTLNSALRFEDVDHLSSGRIRAFKLREVLGS